MLGTWVGVCVVCIIYLLFTDSLNVCGGAKLKSQPIEIYYFLNLILPLISFSGLCIEFLENVLKRTSNNIAECEAQQIIYTPSFPVGSAIPTATVY